MNSKNINRTEIDDTPKTINLLNITNFGRNKKEVEIDLKCYTREQALEIIKYTNNSSNTKIKRYELMNVRLKNLPQNKNFTVNKNYQYSLLYKKDNKYVELNIDNSKIKNSLKTISKFPEKFSTMSYLANSDKNIVKLKFFYNNTDKIKVIMFSNFVSDKTEYKLDLYSDNPKLFNIIMNSNEFRIEKKNIIDILNNHKVVKRRIKNYFIRYNYEGLFRETEIVPPNDMSIKLLEYLNKNKGYIIGTSIEKNPYNYLEITFKSKINYLRLDTANQNKNRFYIRNNFTPIDLALNNLEVKIEKEKDINKRSKFIKLYKNLIRTKDLNKKDNQ